jgi:iron uptake system component EfeO
LDVSTDERYDGFLATAPDDDLFDDQGVTGVHAIERILWSDSIPDRVVKFEETLPGYVAAAFPSNKTEADEFKNKLCKRLITDVRTMHDDFASIALKPSTAFWGMIGSTQEQSEKTTKAASGEDESRYAQRTLADMRANLDGARSVFNAFKPWIDTASSADASKKIDASFDMVAKAYAEVEGPALPEVPEDFNPDHPTDDDLASPYGKLWTLLNQQTNPDMSDSLVAQMGAAANAMGIKITDEQ